MKTVKFGRCDKLQIGLWENLQFWALLLKKLQKLSVRFVLKVLQGELDWIKLQKT